MKDFVLPHELPAILDHAPEGAEVLSLACFGTLLRRHADEPRDIMPRNDVAFAGAYQNLLPNGIDDLRQRAIEAELAAEARNCVAFPPAVQLMKAAKARGFKVIIVSDSCFEDAQLAALIRAVAGEEVLAMIDTIFCPAQHFLSKSEGLFRPVLHALGRPGSAIVHIGSDKAADLAAPAALGIHALHLRQGDAEPALPELAIWAELEEAARPYDAIADRRVALALLCEGHLPRRLLANPSRMLGGPGGSRANCSGDWQKFDPSRSAGRPGPIIPSNTQHLRP